MFARPGKHGHVRIGLFACWLYRSAETQEWMVGSLSQPSRPLKADDVMEYKHRGEWHAAKGPDWLEA